MDTHDLNPGPKLTVWDVLDQTCRLARARENIPEVLLVWRDLADTVQAARLESRRRQWSND